VMFESVVKAHTGPHGVAAPAAKAGTLAAAGSASV
jgi:hypothetical protein